MNRKKISKILCMMLSMNFISSINPMIVHAEEMTTYDKNRMLGACPKEWETSNLREWLNSNKEKVEYSALAPSYKDEKGFLAEFTQSEQDSIAVTKHGIGWQYSLEGNINQTYYWSLRSIAHNDFVQNDKVFILHYTDLANYLEQNKQLPLKKNYSNAIRKITNKEDAYSYLVNSGYYNYGYTGCSFMYTSAIEQVSGRDKQNIVPALSLKPETILSNGAKAKDLVVGSNVIFGKYNGEPIEWQVINKDNGYPLLWSTKILSIKEYDAPGDLNPEKSKYVNFPDADIDLTKGNAICWDNQQLIDSKPKIEIENENDITTPTNNTSLTLKIKAVDSKYPIKKIILPNGKVVEGSSTEWTLTENGEYDIIAINSIGVQTERHIVTKAINTPAKIELTTDKAGDSKWTNRPVNISISATNDGAYLRTVKGNDNMGYGSSNGADYPSWMPLGGKRIRIKGTFKNRLSDKDVENLDIEGAKIRIRISSKWYNNYQIGWTYPMYIEISLKELKEKGIIDIDKIVTIPDNTFSNLHPSVGFMDGSSAWMHPPYNYGISDFTFEVLDKDDLKIENIKLPDGNIVNDSKAKYVAFKNGTYNFEVKDNRGKITTKSIELAIDLDKPNLDVVNLNSNFTKLTTLKISASDSLSGIKSIKLPNGEYRTNSEEGKPLEIEYNIVKNGTYTFETTDFAGNTVSKSITVTNIDDEAPVLNFQSPNEWTDKDCKVDLSATDKASGVESITLPNGEVVRNDKVIFYANENKTYKFTTTDKLGNSKDYTFTVNKIDNIKPELSISVPNNITNSNKEITINANDGQSGINHIIMPDGNVVKGNVAKYVISKNGDISVSAVDNVGNITTKIIHIDTIDKNNPTVKIINNKEWSNKNEEIKIIGSDS